MQTVNIHAAKTQFSKLVEMAASGEEIVTARAGLPVARLVPIASEVVQSKRRLGGLAGKATVPEEFAAPLPDDLLDAFEGA